MNIEECNDCLTLQYKFNIRHIITSFIFIGLGVIFIWVSGKVEHKSWIVEGLVIGALALFLMVVVLWSNNLYEYLVSPLCVFDRVKGEFSIQKRLSIRHKKRIYNITDIKAVRLETASYYNPDFGNMSSFCVSLLVRVGSTEKRQKDKRLVISASAMDGKSQKTVAERVATFLGLALTTIGS